jgi:acetyl-CoA hydrolase
LIRPGDSVVVGQGTAEPTTLTRELLRQRHAIGPARIFLGAVFSDTFALDETDGLSFSGYGAIGGAARLSKAGRLDVLPAQYSQLPGLFADGIVYADVVLLQLSPGHDGDGANLGLANDYVAVAARHARTVIAEFNDQAPWTFGARVPAGLRIDHTVEASYPPVELRTGPPGDAEMRIAAHVAALIPDGATIEIGIGTLPDAILSALGGHRELGVHSGMITDRIADLVEAGVITNARKPFDQGVTTANVLFGTARLNALAHHNPAFQIREQTYTHGADVLSKIPHLRAINSAIEVDLSGQVNAEVANGQYIGAVGGQVDFVRGANAAPHGRSIIALPATAKQGQISRIVGTLANGTVTSLRSDADLVVTEFGIAELRGKTLAERARRMIAIAAPQFQESLSRAANAVLKAAE